MRMLLATVAAMLAAPASALAAGPTMAVRDVPLRAPSNGDRTLAVAAPRFNLVGLHWQGAGAVLFRTRDAAGGWSAWRTADADSYPDRQSAESGPSAWRLGGLEWTGSSTVIRFRTRGRVTRLRAYYVWSPPEPLASRRIAIANAPSIVPRSSWSADESIRKGTPQIAPVLRYAVVHHTAGSNDYTPAQAAAIVRGIELYHVEGNGWNDIGYNFLVDKYGQVFEGRFGGVDKAVVGAHAQGFNTGSVGVAVLGSYGSTGISAAARRSLVQLLAWKLDLAHVDPLSTLTVLSGGNPRFPAGVPVFLRAIAGHRDTNFTDCPGEALYAELPQIAGEVAAAGGPKVYAPDVARDVEGQVRFTATLSSSLPWTVTVLDSSGTQVAQGSGSGARVDWTWDASLAPPGRYTWSIAAGTARPATGSLGGVAALAVQKAAASPAVLPAGAPTTVSYTLTVPATVAVTLLDSTGQPVSAPVSAVQPAGAQTLALTLPPGLPEGHYTVAVNATSGPRAAAATVPLTVDDLLTAFTASPASFSAARGAAATVSFAFARPPLAASFQVLSGTAPVATTPAPLLVTGSQTISWNGTLDDGSRAPDGIYTLALTITDDVGTFVRETTVALDSTPPAVAVVSYRSLRFRLSEPVTLTLAVGAARYTRTVPRAATTQFWLRTKPAAYTLVATDAAGNTTAVRYRRR